MTLGLEIRDAAVTAVAVDAAGRVVARAEQPLENDPAAGAGRALAAVAAGAGEVADLGLAIDPPPSDAAATDDRLVAGLAPRRVRATAVPGMAAAMAEAWTGAARGAGDVIYFGVADHVAAGVLRGGVPATGAHGHAPAVAWMSLNPVEREDYRRVGCLEAEVGGAGIVRRLVWRVKAGDPSRVEDLVGGDLTAISVEHVLAAARDRDGVSISVVRDTAKYLGMAAANLLLFADPEVLVLGGLMASAADLFLEPVRVELARRVPAALAESVTVVAATLGADAPAIGAARLASLA